MFMDPTHLAFPLLGLAVASGLTTVLITPAAKRLALRAGILDAPGARKLHGKPVPYLGGVAVIAAVAIGWTISGLGWVQDWPAVDRTIATPLVIGALAMMLLGLVDDVRGLSPRVRLVGQVLIVIAVLSVTGTVDSVRLGGLEFTGLPAALSFGVAGFWVLSLTNAGNMMDGMDGLAAGVGAIAAAVFAYLAVAVYEDPGVGAVLALVAGAYAGFLVFNAHPARIYLGDAGSLPLGFLLGTGALYATTTADGVWHLAPALLVSGVPATDLLLAVLRRGLSSVRIERLAGTAERFVFRLVHPPRFFEGDQGHLHHRLLGRLGSVQRAVYTLYAAAALFGALGIWAAREPQLAPMLVVGAVLLGLMAVSRFLHPELRVFEKGFLLPLFHTREVGNRRLHFLFDVLVFSGAFVIAGWVGSRWGPTSWLDAVRVALAGLTGPTVMALLGLYRIHFRRAGVWSIWRAASTVGAGAAAVLLVDTLAVQMPLASASGLLFVYLALTGSLVPRAAYGFMDEAYARRPHGGRTTLIYGTGRAELAFLQRALSSDELGLRPIGFLVEAVELEGKMIQGFPAYRADGEVTGLIRSLGVEAVVVVGDPRGDAHDLRLHLAVRAAGAALLRYRESIIEAVPLRGGRSLADEATSPRRAPSSTPDRRSGSDG
jgi:UDP-GlcNAc:undecaprenyl-phosphate/decaprenyl-phosphate GlcNAc-1-phosphate transferase